jgi:hypothetical protein
MPGSPSAPGTGAGGTAKYQYTVRGHGSRIVPASPASGSRLPDAKPGG